MGASHAEVGSGMSSPSLSDQELLDLVDAQHVTKLLSEGARKGLLGKTSTCDMSTLQLLHAARACPARQQHCTCHNMH